MWEYITISFRRTCSSHCFYTEILNERIDSTPKRLDYISYQLFKNVYLWVDRRGGRRLGPHQVSCWLDRPRYVVAGCLSLRIISMNETIVCYKNYFWTVTSCNFSLSLATFFVWFKWFPIKYNYSSLIVYVYTICPL